MVHSLSCLIRVGANEITQTQTDDASQETDTQPHMNGPPDSFRQDENDNEGKEIGKWDSETEAMQGQGSRRPGTIARNQGTSHSSANQGGDEGLWIGLIPTG